jgi:hypothetical protein
MVLRTIVTSAYELNYEQERSGAVYKSFSLLTETLDALIHDDFNYIIYTDRKTSDKHNLEQKYNRTNIKLVYKELDSEFYTNIINPVRERKFQAGEKFDRIYAVKNYEEVIINKLENLLENSHIHHAIDREESIIWLDAGLFGTSCSNAWRDYMRRMIYGKKIFLEKIFEKVEKHRFICTKGNNIIINYELKDRLKNLHGVDVSIVPGCLFGGKKDEIQNVLQDYKLTLLNHINTYQELISEQEILSILTDKKEVKFYEFNDWDDLQKAFLKIMDVYDETVYNKDECYKFVL